MLWFLCYYRIMHSSMFDDNSECDWRRKKFAGLLKNLSAVILVRLVMARIRHVNQDYFQILLIIFLFLGVLTFCSHDYTLMPFLFILVSEDSYLIYIYIYDGFNIHVIQISCWWKLSCQILIHLGFWDWFYIIFKSVFDLRKY